MSDLIADWAIALAASGVIAEGAVPTPTSSDVDRFELASLPSIVEWSAPGAYARPGIAPNGSDVVRHLSLSGYAPHRLRVNGILQPGRAGPG